MSQPTVEGLPQGILIASNRGPVAFQRGPDGELVARRGAGGLVTALTHVMVDTGGLWLACGLTKDRASTPATYRSARPGKADRCDPAVRMARGLGKGAKGGEPTAA